MKTGHLSRSIAFMFILIAGCHSAPAVHYEIHADYAIADPQFARTMGNMLGPPLVGGNEVKSLRNGDEIFPAILSAIRAAKNNINLETYIYWSGDIGSKLTDALVERASAGVKVRVIMDWLGSGKVDPRYLKKLKDAGVQWVEFHPVKWWNVSTAARLNNRTHRKIIVIDGSVGFTGGVGIADYWLGNADSPEHWRDMHYRVEGPIVAQLQAAFLDNWLKTTGQVLGGPEYFPALASRGDEYCQVFMSGPHGGSESMELMYLLSVAGARQSICIGNAYFVPGKQLIEQLLAARRRGVRVRIIVPGPHLDEKIVQPASRSRWGELLKEGVEIYEYQPTMYHTKLLIVDNLWVSVGSSNLDNRSFRLNDEANLNVLDAGFAAAQTRIFEDDLAHSKRYTYQQWKKRPWTEEFLEAITSFITPLL